MIKKIITIVFSRFKKPTEESFVTVRREICKTCPLNTKNQEKLTFKTKVIKALSDFYSSITGNREVDNIGNCSVCGCSLYYMTGNRDESCSDTPKKWNRVTLPKRK